MREEMAQISEANRQYLHGGNKKTIRPSGAGRIALFPSEPAMGDGGGGRYGIAVFVGQLGSAQTHYQIVNQLRKMSATLVVARTKMVEFRGLLCWCQPICDQRGLAAGQDCGPQSSDPWSWVSFRSLCSVTRRQSLPWS